MKYQLNPSWLIKLVLAIVLLVVVFLRLWKLEDYPPGLFSDEASIGLNASSLLYAQTDEYGTPLPLYFKAYGDYKNPILIYSLVPIFAVIDVSIASLRLASALWGLLTLSALILLLRQANTPKIVILATIIIAGLNPWHFHLSRISFELITLPFFLVAGAFCLYPLLEKREIRRPMLWSLGFGSMLGLMFYSYTAGRLLAPLLLTGGAYLIYKRRGLRPALVTLGSFGLWLVPLAVADRSLITAAMTARYQVLGLNLYYRQPLDFLSQLMSNYVSHFHPEFILHGDTFLRHTPYPYGLVTPSGLFVTLLGLWALVFRRTSYFGAWCAWALLISPLPSALAIQAPHALRSIGWLGLILIFTSQAVTYLYQRRGQDSVKLGSLILAGWLAIESGSMIGYVFGTLTRQLGPWFEQDQITLLQKGFDQPQPHFVSLKIYDDDIKAPAAFVGLSKLPGYPSPFEFIDPHTTSHTKPGTYILDLKTCLNPYLHPNQTLYSGPSGCVVEMVSDP